MARAKNIGTMYAELSVKDKMSAGMKYARTQIKALNKDLGALGTSFAGFASVAAGGIAVSGISKAIREASKMEVLETQFSALLKSEEEAIKLIEKLRKMNVESPLGVEDFSKGAKQLLGVRMTADDAAIALDKLSNISMGNAENFDSLVRAFAQTRSAGRLMGQEVLQFVNAGFNPLAEISIKTGESMAALKKRMEDGKISFQEVEGAITSATAAGGLFNGMNAKMAATMEGKMQKLKDNFNQFFIALGKPINEKLKPELDKLNAFDFSKLGKSLGDELSNAFEAIADGGMWEIFVKQGQLAIEKLRGPSGMEGFAAFANAVFDGITAKYNEGYNFSESYDKYLNAGMEVNTEKIKQYEKELEDIYLDIAQRRQSREAQKPIEMMGPPISAIMPATPIIPVEIQKTAATQKSLDFQASNFELGQGPRAGLSLNADGGASMAKRSIDYLAKIADILGQAKIQDKQLVWG